jgi:protein-L-isoaspartate(D-aspartate) O-methyltransferase
MTATADPDLDVRADQLRQSLVDQLLADRRITTAAVGAAFRVVPRHIFAPEVDLEAAYADDAVKIKFDGEGTCLSSLSAPWLQALMIEQAALRPGDRVLEIGSAGYQAALLAEVVTRAGLVVSLDIDPDITDRAAGCLERAGYDRVVVALGDGEAGWAADAPFDATIVCAQAYDIPPAWTGQLAPGGRLIVPLYLLGQRRTLTFVADGDRWIATNSIYSGFVNFRGSGGLAANSTRITLGDTGVALTYAHGDPDRPGELADALDYPAAQAWSGVLPGSPGYIGGLQMYLATRMPAVADCPRESLPHPEGVRVFGPVCTVGGNLGYVAVRGAAEQSELGAVAYGPQAQQLADRMVGVIADWVRDVRDGPGMTIALYRRDTPDDQLPDGRVVDTAHRRIVIAWPSADTPQAQSAIEA